MKTAKSFYFMHLQLFAPVLTASLHLPTSSPALFSGKTLNMTLLSNDVLLNFTKQLKRHVLCLAMSWSREDLPVAVPHPQTLATTNRPAPSRP